MRVTATILASFVLLGAPFTGASALVESGKYEVSGYFNVATLGKNVSIQSDLGLGLRVSRFLDLGFTSNISYRNYGLESNEYLGIAIGKSFGNHEVRFGPVAGVYTLWLAGYSITLPTYGAEAVYSYSISPGFSIRLKERIYGFQEREGPPVSTITLLGFCYGFGGPPFF